MKLFDLSSSEFKTLLNVLTSFKSQKSVTIYDSCIEMVSKNGTYIFSNMSHFFRSQGITAKFNINKSGIKSLKNFLDTSANIEFHQDTVTGKISLQQNKLKRELQLPEDATFINTDDIEEYSQSITLKNHFINSYNRADPLNMELDNRHIKGLYQKFSHYEVKTERWLINQKEYVPSGDLIFEPAEFLPFEADSFEISIWTDENSNQKLITSYVVDGIEVFAYGEKKKETKKEIEKKEEEKKKEKKYKDRFPQTYNLWEKFGFYTLLPELENKDRVITDISPRSYDNFLRYLTFFLPFENLKIIDGMISHQAEVLIQADLGGFFTGDTKDVTFLIEDVREFLEKMKEVFGINKVDSVPSLLTSRPNMVVIEKDIEPVGLNLPFEAFDKQLALFSSLPVPKGNTDYKIRRLDLLPFLGNQRAILFQNQIPISNKLNIPIHVKQSISGDNRFVLISLFGPEIESTVVFLPHSQNYGIVISVDK
jgi:hypothetical protein